MRSSLEIESITCGPLLGESDHLVLEMDHKVKQEVLKDTEDDPKKDKVHRGRPKERERIQKENIKTINT